MEKACSIFVHQHCFSALGNFAKIGKTFCEKETFYMAFCCAFILLNFLPIQWEIL